MSGSKTSEKKLRRGRGAGVWLAALFSLFLLTRCGAVDFFFFVNTGTVESSRRDGLVVIIGTPIETEAESVRVASGVIPAGMEAQVDGTVRGIPEESGFFDFTLELAFADQSVQTLEFSVEIEE